MCGFGAVVTCRCPACVAASKVNKSHSADLLTATLTWGMSPRRRLGFLSSKAGYVVASSHVSVGRHLRSQKLALERGLHVQCTHRCLSSMPRLAQEFKRSLLSLGFAPDYNFEEMFLLLDVMRTTRGALQRVFLFQERRHAGGHHDGIGQLGQLMQQAQG